MGHTSFQTGPRAVPARRASARRVRWRFSPAFLGAGASPRDRSRSAPGPYGPLRRLRRQRHRAPGRASPRARSPAAATLGRRRHSALPLALRHRRAGDLPDPRRGGAPDGGWILVANSESRAPGGGVSAVEFAPTARSSAPTACSLGPAPTAPAARTPWGTWLSLRGARRRAGARVRPDRRSTAASPAPRWASSRTRRPASIRSTSAST